MWWRRRAGTVRASLSLVVVEPTGVIMTEQKQPPSSGSSGDDRTPDKTIGEVKYARGQDRKEKKGGAGEPQVSDLEPEKQGGIGGP
jgi:hypothetical protein